MPFYHLRVKLIGRSQGRSAVACAAYRAGQTLADERYGLTHHYSHREGILETGILAPDNAPAWAYDREKLWNRVEATEKRKDSQLAREFTMALPHQISDELRKELVETFVAEQLLPRGMVVDYAIHAPNPKGDQRNFHAHLMMPTRPLEGGGFSSLKDRSINRRTIKAWRQSWADLQNRTFERLLIRDENGEILHVDHRSYAGRGIDREPTQHMGVLAMAMERGGTPTEIGDKNRAIQKANDLRESLVRSIQELYREELALTVRDSNRDNRRRFDRDPDFDR